MEIFQCPKKVPVIFAKDIVNNQYCYYVILFRNIIISIKRILAVTFDMNYIITYNVY